jgi:stearoyl-CoA desaturase (delta-9 desaturase)
LELPPGTERRIAWRYAAPILGLHALSLLAFVPWLFSWTGFVLFLAGVYIYGGLGINLGYHRLLTHRSFECPAWLEKFFVLVAICCLEDAPAIWVANHRLHHKDSDTHPDPHTPLVSFAWSHMGWLLVTNPSRYNFTTYDRYARDIIRTPFYLWLQRGYNAVWIYLTHAALYFLIGLAAGAWMHGTAMGGVQFGLSLLVWGVVLRTVGVWHITWSVNSLTHLWGYRNYKTGEESRNNWFVALLASGEGWHNNHHADPSSASNWHRWWEWDNIWLFIRLLEHVGLAWNVVYPRQVRQRIAKPR